MQFKSLKELVQIVENSLLVQFSLRSVVATTSTSVLRKSVLKVLAFAVGGALHLVTLIANKIWKNSFVWSCDSGRLDGFGTEYDLPHKPPLYASGFVRVALADGTISAVIPAGTVLVDSSSHEYEVVNSATVTSEATDVQVIALVPGSDSNLESGAELQFRDGDIAGIESLEAKDVTGGFLVKVSIDGVVQEWGETAETYRARLKNRIQNPVSGVSKNDYWLWATKFQYVTDAYVIPHEPNVNSVSVAIANYNNENLTCTQTQVDEVMRYVSDDIRRPIGADVRVFSVTPVAVVISADITPYSESVKESVSTAVKQFLRSVSPGQVVSIDDLTLAVRSNSIAQTFDVKSMSKAGSSVSELSFLLVFPSSQGEEIVAEVARCTVNLKKAGT